MGTMVMDRKPKSLSERISGASRGMQSRSAGIPSLMSNSKPVAQRSDNRGSTSMTTGKKKAVQRLGMQARLGAKAQTQSAKERLTLSALPSAKRANPTSISQRFQRGPIANYQMNRKAAAPFRKSASNAGQKPANPPSKSANDLDKELEEFMSHK